ncbi:MAG: signal peptidase II [Deltaproteobacteria bacterium]|nr:signal peptidase II [Deltaproteobacteria bacterium]
MSEKKSAPMAKYVLMIFILLAGCNTDLYTKHLVSKSLEPGESITLTGGYLEIKHAQNKSASFSMLDSIDFNVRRPLLIALQVTGSLFVLALIVVRRRQSFGLLLPYVLILAGAIGNAVDRVRLGYVVDFIYFHIKHYFHWPVFNVADILITIGMMLLILQVIVSQRRTPTSA